MTLAQRVWTMDGPSPDGYGVMSVGTFGWLWWVALGLGVIVWIALARSSLVHGGEMERSDRVPQLYGYTVCLIALVVMLVNVSSIVNQSFALSDPLAGDRYGWGGAVLTSFETYKATVGRMDAMAPPTSAASTAPKPTDAELRTQYEALRADRIARTRLDARREMTQSILMLIIAAALFAWHWRWVRRERSA